MAPKIQAEEMKTTVFAVKGGGIFQADGRTPAPYSGSNIRTSNIPTANGNPHGPTDVNKHFAQGFNPLSFTLRADSDKQVLRFGPPGTTENIVYLPYYDDNITSTVIPTTDASVCYFITDEMSGCNFFIDELPNGNLVCYHANAKLYSPTDAEKKADAGAFNPLAPATMETQHSTAMTLDAYRGAKNVAKLRVAEYLAQAQSSVDRKVAQGRTDVEYYGGTTIMGFRGSGKWEFWFQTYTQLSYHRTGLASAIKGEVNKPENKPPKIIEARRFWAQ